MFEDELDEIDYLVGMIHFRIFQCDGILIVAEHSVQFRLTPSSPYEMSKRPSNNSASLAMSDALPQILRAEVAGGTSSRASRQPHKCCGQFIVKSTRSAARQAIALKKHPAS
jgi:hypothetical protein